MKRREAFAWALVAILLFASTIPAKGHYGNTEGISHALYKIAGALMSSSNAEWQQAYYLKQMAEKCP